MSTTADPATEPATPDRESRLRWFVRKGSSAIRLGAGRFRARLLGLIPGLFFDRVGKGTIFFGFPRFQHLGGRISVGQRCTMGTRVFFLTGGTGRISIGDRSSINDYGIITSLSSIEIESDVAIGEFVSIRDYDHEFDGYTSLRKLGYVSEPIVIRKHAWIGRGCMILKGVTIGEGAVIGANSVVTRDIPPHVVAAGTPARVIRELRPNGESTDS